LERDPFLTLNQVELFPSLRIVKGKNAPMRIPVIGERISIGRRRGDLVVADPEVSGQHAEIVRTSAGYVLRDLASTNGTFLNGQPVKEQVLQPGDEIGIGRTVIQWEVPHAAGADVTRDAPVSEGGDQQRIPVGIYDTLPEFAGLGALVEDALPGFQDDDGTQLMDLQSAGINMKLPAHSVVQLEIVGGPEKGRVVTLPSGNVVIGRYGTDVVLKDSDISRRHLAIEAYGRDQIFMRDLGSTNGSYVNGVRAGFSKLQSGDTLVVGRSVMQLVVKDL
jgi:pSer/pThr/pTyr-binding forkhead associated (FHA) protein